MVRRREYTSHIERALWRALAAISPEVQMVDGEFDGEEVGIFVRMTPQQRAELRRMLREEISEREIGRVMR